MGIAQPTPPSINALRGDAGLVALLSPAENIAGVLTRLDALVERMRDAGSRLGYLWRRGRRCSCGDGRTLAPIDDNRVPSRAPLGHACSAAGATNCTYQPRLERCPALFVVGAPFCRWVDGLLELRIDRRHLSQQDIDRIDDHRG